MNRYVSTSGSDSATGELTKPWKTLKRALTALRPGDTLYVRVPETRRLTRTPRRDRLTLLLTRLREEIVLTDSGPLFDRPEQAAAVVRELDRHLQRER